MGQQMNPPSMVEVNQCSPLCDDHPTVDRTSYLVHGRSILCNTVLCSTISVFILYVSLFGFIATHLFYLHHSWLNPCERALYAVLLRLNNISISEQPKRQMITQILHGKITDTFLNELLMSNSHNIQRNSNLR